MGRLPDCGIACWPVGNGDAITLVASDGLVIQLDINDSNTDDNDWAPVVDLLADELRTIDIDGTSKPELPVVMISHHDTDHCYGIERLFDEFQVNELIITLRCFVETDDLTELGEILLEEAERRRDQEIEAADRGERADPGHRLQIVGYADILETAGWEKFPESLVTIPGDYIPTLDGEDHSGSVEVFVHSPFREDTEGSTSRNDTCLGVQVTMTSGECTQRYLLLGDLEHETIEAIVERSAENGNEERLEWDVLVAPHHDSRHAVRRKTEDGWVDADAATYLAKYAQEDAVVIISSNGKFTEPSETGADPPHADALQVYERIVGKTSVLRTHDEAKGADSYPVTVTAEVGNCGTTPTRAERASRLVKVAASLGTPLAAGDRRLKGTDRGFA